MRWLALSLCVAVLGCGGDPVTPADGAVTGGGATDAGPIEIGDPMPMAGLVSRDWFGEVLGDESAATGGVLEGTNAVSGRVSPGRHPRDRS